MPRRRPLLLAAGVAFLTIALAGCGFRPLYGGAPYAALAGARVEAGPERVDYLVQNALRDHLGAGDSRYRITLNTETDERSLGVSASGRATRYALVITVDYRLDGGPEAVSGRISETAYFDAPNEPYALIATRSNAEERAARLAAERLARALAAQLQPVTAGRGAP
ncbi:LPS assembly lipoprotein LptE [Marinicauda salina]|nr:LPS assembly lipoprotein LptE [Marinicauda salina]